MVFCASSSNINDGIKAVLFFLRKDFACTKKHKMQRSNFLLDVFYVHKKHKKAQKAQNTKQVTFFLLDVFYVHKNAACFVFVHLDYFKLLCFFTRKFYMHKKHRKHIKSIKTQISK